MYRKSIRTKRLEAKRKRCAAMRAAKERKRMERVSAMNGKGSARMRSSDARRYADGWRRVFGGGRGRRDSGGKEGQSENNVKKVRQGVDNTKRLAYVVNQ